MCAPPSGDSTWAESWWRRIIEDARSLGYSRLMLDTMPELVSARHMYGSMGFKLTERYNNSPLDTTIFMEYRL